MFNLYLINPQRAARADSAKDIAKQMMETTVPADHQALGRKAKGFNRKEWDERKSVFNAGEMFC